ncbi:hypothetical protein P280DRAFT_477398 [Massarina eburnea CBS 473.64]|uniref:Small ribosomal subunit protein mS38 n=1 Tax=Massarina eburnea CBS 473.64 TaxID=1395130 RepID=A0A6A6S9R7_9PLEO|nr:hypothetical protein P280DRAFT_477398 [Massarina eburnea CBS 473.64]
MFNPAIGRVVRFSSALTAPSARALGRHTAIGAAQQPFSRRRLSSSKASIPPAGSNANGSSSAQQTPAGAGKAPTRKATGRTTRKRSTTPALNVPHVPPTDYLQKPEVKMSSFFSLHRPISLTTPIPPVATNSSFDSIFKVRPLNDRKAIMGNIQTLSTGIENLEQALRAHDKQAQEDTIHVEAEVMHLDGPPLQASIDQVMSRLVPFRPPPAPVPFSHTVQSDLLAEGADDALVATLPAKQRAWTTELVVTESTDASGKRTYSATTAPMVEISAPTTEQRQKVEDIEIRQPFLERMKKRQDTHTRYRDNLGRPDMLAISVKRQRKLKMKKHKYKKLMKRTRLMRRKLDRL